MQVSSVNSMSYQPMGSSESIAQMKQSFENLGSALQSGNLSDAKVALTQLQKNAPTRSGNENNPLSAKIEKLANAIDSGDLKAAQTAYADIKETMSQGPSAGGGRASGSGGAPSSGAMKSSGTGGNSSSNKVYDKKDINKDGTVSAEEELAYSLNHPETATKTSTTASSDSGGLLDAMV